MKKRHNRGGKGGTQGYLVIHPNGHSEFIFESGGLGLARMQGIVGGRINCIALTHGLDMWVHDEGKFVCSLNRPATAIYEHYLGAVDVVFGTAILAGVDAEGEAKPIPRVTGSLLQGIAAAAHWTDDTSDSGLTSMEVHDDVPLSAETLGQLILRRVRPAILRHFDANSCVATARVTIDVLAHFGVDAVPLPTEAHFFNAEAMRLLRSEEPDRTEALLRASSRDAFGGPWAVSLGAADDGQDGTAGHVTVYVPRWNRVYDLSADQASRPHKGLTIGPAELAIDPDADWVQDSSKFGSYEVSQPEKAGFRAAVAHYRVAPHRLYEQSPNWRGVSRGSSTLIPGIVDEVSRDITDRLAKQSASILSPTTR